MQPEIQAVDLWGDPIPPRIERRGRPQHVVTPEKRIRVAVLRAMRHSHEEIAAAMGISEPTLRKNYLPELKSGLAQKRAEVLVRLWEKVQEGNVTAMKEFMRQTEKSDLAPRELRPPKPTKLGKKDQALVDAQQPDVSSSMGELMARRAAGEFKLH